MKVRYLLDTCTVSYVINNRYANVRQKLITCLDDDIAISAISYAELIHGLKKKGSIKLEQAINNMCELVPVLPFDDHCALIYGEMRVENEKKGISLGSFDGLIAAHAIRDKRILVSKDKAFGLIKNLMVEDWTI